MAHIQLLFLHSPLTAIVLYTIGVMAFMGWVYFWLSFGAKLADYYWEWKKETRTEKRVPPFGWEK